MLILVATSSIVLTALQASINAPADAFRGCLREATTKAKSDKVAPDGIADYFRNNCSVQMDTLRKAVVAFRVKNGMARKAALDDAELTVEDYMAAPIDRYQVIAEINKSAPPPPAPAAAPTNPSPPPPKP